MEDHIEGFEEALGGQLGHQDASAGVLHTGSVLLRAEDAYLTVLPAEGLQTFEGLLPVVKAGRGHGMVIMSEEDTSHSPHWPLR